MEIRDLGTIKEHKVSCHERPGQDKAWNALRNFSASEGKGLRNADCESLNGKQEQKALEQGLLLVPGHRLLLWASASPPV